MLARTVFLDSLPTRLFATEVASGAARVLCWLGIPTQATGYVVASENTAIRVGAGCAASPTLVIVIVALLTLPLTLKTRLSWFTLVLPLFYLLNVLRVVGVIAALLYWPSIWRWVEDYFLLTSLLIGITFGLGQLYAQRMESRQKRRFWSRLGGSIGVWFLVGGLYEQALLWGYQQVLASMDVFPAKLLPHNPERVLTALPVFQDILFLTFAVSCQWGWQWTLIGGAGLYGSQLLCLLSVFFFSQNLGVSVHHYFVRGWIIVIPCALIWRFTQPRSAPVTARADNSQA